MINFMHDFWQSSIVSKLRNHIGDVLGLPQWDVSFQDAVTRIEFAFFASLPPTVIYHHIFVWQLQQNMRAFGSPNLGFMQDGEMGVHQIVASCMSTPFWLMLDIRRSSV